MLGHYLTVKVTDGKFSRLVKLKGGMGQIPDAEVFSLNGLTYQMEYGSTRIEMPFYIGCKDFRLEKYPGSEIAELDVRLPNSKPASAMNGL